MGLFLPERRSISYQDVWGRGGDWIGGNRSDAGIAVNADSALGLSAVLRCVRLLSDTVSTLPLHAYRDGSSGRMELPSQPALVTSPSTVLSLEEWLQQAMVSLLLHGNAYGVVLERDRMQVATAVGWVNPSSVEVEQRSALMLPRYLIGGEEVRAEDVLHVRAFLKPGSVVGAAPLAMSKETFGLGLAAQKFGAQWFGDGATPSAVLTTDHAIDQDQAVTIKQRFLDAVRGRREPAVLGAGMKYQQIQVAANESQFLETQQAVVADVARAFGVPVEMIGGAGSGSLVTYANREQSAIDFLTFSLTPWLVRLERALSRQLPRGQFVKFNPDALLRTDTKSRYQAHAVGLAHHFLTIDEVRGLEDRQPLGTGEMFPPSSASQGTSTDASSDAGDLPTEDS